MAILYTIFYRHELQTAPPYDITLFPPSSSCISFTSVVIVIPIKAPSLSKYFVEQIAICTCRDSVDAVVTAHEAERPGVNASFESRKEGRMPITM